MRKKLLLVFLIAGITIANAQFAPNPMYENLPIGKYTVGFKIITLTDDSRIDKPAFNYFGEKITGDRSHSFSVHIWYPAKPNTGKGIVTYGEYSSLNSQL